MNIHNKFEIKTPGGTTIIAKNRIFDRVFDCYTNYTGFTTYVSIGDAVVDLACDTRGSLNNEQMTQSLGIFKTQDAEYSLDANKGALFARHKIILPAGALAGKSISEIGFCVLPSQLLEQAELGEDSVITLENLSPTLYNYAYFAKPNGEPISYTIQQDETIEIYATIYLDWNVENGIVPLVGDNKFLQFLLGTNVYNGTMPSFNFGLGQNLQPNTVPVDCNYTPCERYFTKNIVPKVTRRQGMIEFLFAAVGNGANYVAELLLTANGQPAVRQCRYEMHSDEIMKETVVCSVLGTIPLKRQCVGKIVKIVNTTTGETIEDPVELEKIKKIQYGGLFSEAVPMPLGSSHDYNLNAGWRAFDSKCGALLAMVSSDTIDIFKHHSNHTFTKLDSSAIADPQTITNIEFFEPYVFVIRNIAPYVDCYKWIDGTLCSMAFDLQTAIASNETNKTFTNAETQYISFGKDTTDAITCVIKYSQSVAPGVFRFVDTGRVLILDSYERFPLKVCNLVSALLAKGNIDGTVVAAGIDSTDLECVYLYNYGTGFTLLESQLAAKELNNTVIRQVDGAGFIYVQRSSTPYNVMLRFPVARRFFLYNEPTVTTYVSKSGAVSSRYNSAGNKFQGMYLTDDLTLQACSNQPDESIYTNVLLDVKHFDSSLIMFRSEPPYTYYFSFDGRLFTVLHGFVAGNKYEVHEEMLAPFTDRTKRNQMLSLVIYLDNESDGNAQNEDASQLIADCKGSYPNTGE